MELIINPRFKSLLPRLTAEELAMLEKSLITDGCRDPLHVWNRTIVDGHNRYEICTRLNIPFEIRQVEFENEDAAMDWIDTNQLGRRNLTPDAFKLALGRHYNRIKKQGARTDLTLDQIDTKLNTAVRLAAEYGVSEATVKRAGLFAREVEKSPELQEAIYNNIPVYKARREWESDEDPVELPVEKRPVSYHVSDDSYDWYTPEEYIYAAKIVMGNIDLDPASSNQAQEMIQAGKYYTKEDDGLIQEWGGRVWLNPPYNMPLIEQFVDRVIAEYESGRVTSAIVLTNNSTDTGWFHKLIVYPVCFTRGRIQFWNGNDRLATRQGQALFYLGDNPDLFADTFGIFGVVLKKYDNQ